MRGYVASAAVMVSLVCGFFWWLDAPSKEARMAALAPCAMPRGKAGAAS